MVFLVESDCIWVSVGVWYTFTANIQVGKVIEKQLGGQRKAPGLIFQLHVSGFWEDAAAGCICLQLGLRPQGGNVGTSESLNPPV